MADDYRTPPGGIPISPNCPAHGYMVSRAELAELRKEVMAEIEKEITALEASQAAARKRLQAISDRMVVLTGEDGKNGAVGTLKKDVGALKALAWKLALAAATGGGGMPYLIDLLRHAG